MTYSIPFSLTYFIAEASAAVATKTSAQEKQDALAELMMDFSAENRFESAKKMFDKTTDDNSLSYHMLHCDSELSVVYTQLPPKFQSAAFDHATECVTMTLQGIEGNTFYEKQPDASLKPVHHETVAMGKTLLFPKDSIRTVENKSSKVSTKVLMCFLGDLREHNEMRHVYDLASNTEVPFSFDAVVEHGSQRMAGHENGKSVAADESAAAPETAQLMQ